MLRLGSYLDDLIFPAGHTFAGADALLDAGGTVAVIAVVPLVDMIQTGEDQIVLLAHHSHMDDGLGGKRTVRAFTDGVGNIRGSGLFAVVIAGADAQHIRIADNLPGIVVSRHQRSWLIVPIRGDGRLKLIESVLVDPQIGAANRVWAVQRLAAAHDRQG